MNRMSAPRTLFVTVLVALPFAVQATTLRPTPSEVQDQIRIMETSISDSSVSDRLSESDRADKLALLQRARDLAAEGNQTTALDLVEQAGRLLYPMERHDTVTLSEGKRRAWLEEIVAVMETVLPAAFGIAEEKGVVNADLVTAASLRDHGVAKLAAGDLEAADNLLVDAYNRMQMAVAELRSGELLTVSLESDDPRVAWAEAQRRYQDWLVTSNWMEAVAPAIEADAAEIAAGRTAADAIYREALAHAEAGHWQMAVDTIDRAYLVMEDHWRTAGIDI